MSSREPFLKTSHNNNMSYHKNSTVSEKENRSQFNVQTVSTQSKISNPFEDFRDSTDDVSANADQMPYLAACLFGTVLEDSITTMRILAECNNSLRVTKTMADMENLLAVKFSVPPAANIDPLGKIDPQDLGRAEYKLDKLQADRNFLLGVFTSTYLDMALERCFESLTKHSASMVYREQHYLKLLDDEATNRATRRDLNRQIRQQRVHIKTVTYDTDAVIEKLRTQVEDAALNAEIQSRYIGNWERSRTEQHDRNIADRELQPSNEIEIYKQRLDFEQRVHTEFELLNNIIINETLEKIEEWMNKYDTDMEGIDLSIQIMRSNYETTLEKRHGLEDTFENHATLIKDWIAFKEERERIRQYRELMTNSAIVVQAWWRGLLVRLKLGPYKEQPAKKKGKK